MTVRCLLGAVTASATVRTVVEALRRKRSPVFLSSFAKYGNSLLVAALISETRRPAAIVVPEPEDAVETAREMKSLLGEDRVLSFPPREAIPFQTGGPEERTWERLTTLKSLTFATNTFVVVTPVAALMRKLSPPGWFRSRCGAMGLGDNVAPGSVLANLVAAGYERVSSVEQRGQVALRGGILDFFSPDSSLPVRVEFAFDEIVSLRTFDPLTQVSEAPITRAFYVPAVEVAGDTPPNPACLSDFLPEDAAVIMSGYHHCRETAQEMDRIAHEIATSRLLTKTMRPEEAAAYFTWDELWQRLKHRVDVLVQGIMRRVEGLQPGLVIEAETLSQVAFRGRFDDLLQAVKQMLAGGRRVSFVFASEERRQILRSRLEEAGVSVRTSSPDCMLERGSVYVLSGYARSGVTWPSEKIEVFTEAEVFPRARISPARSKTTAAIPLDWRELRPGDYVVHVHHGIGQYMGLRTMTVAGVTRDYVHVRYAGDDAVYVPTDQLHLLEKYTGRDGHVPALSRLGSGEWLKTRTRAKQAVEKLAAELLRTQAIRKTRRSHHFGPDTVWQKEFEEAFEYDETPDQARAASEVKRDMEKSVPMDRLLCGDVGFGKTEVAMRAAFKAVQESKQVAVLVPTTILAEQHYATFSQRFKDYGINIEVLSRFRSRREQKVVVDGLRMGTVDIVIGTHRLLGEDVRFRDLGLLIIDEEHKFGVAQKERLKKLRETVHVLTLSATPIPRTLNMALGRLIDISLIDTPPEGRFPVETYVIPYSKPVLAEAIRREIARGGQVFYVCHRISGMDSAVRRITEMVPEATVACAHGRMAEAELARVVRDFLAGGYDILVSTTIIESGLDFPNVNTLIVENADKLGLAQLYQLRGRVGRRNRIAYAYFTFRPDRYITEKGEERLRALKELHGSGSGLRLALRDLELRGAGNILGPEQHGFIDSVGLDLYMKLLDGAIAELQGHRDEEQQVIRAEVDIPVNAYLPMSYVEHERERYVCYKKIAGCESWTDVDQAERDIRDIYGPLPEETRNLLDVSRLSLALGSLGMTQVSLDQTRRALVFKIEIPHCFPRDEFLGSVSLFRGRLRGSLDEGRIELFLDEALPQGALREALRLARSLLPSSPGVTG